ncbi:MAG: MFS transporter [Candidatus Lokiarchaeota archaeon]|nr:MFS transporter [Candidatus Lokiarchaeota archaeon]
MEKFTYGDLKRKPEGTAGLRVLFSVGEISDIIAYQGFTFLIFTFYSAVMRVNINAITVVYIIWTLWNSLNDVIFGTISDRSRFKKFLGGGRRGPYMRMMVLPLALIMVLLFLSPIEGVGEGAGETGLLLFKIGNIPFTVQSIYMLIVMIFFDTIYTIYSINHTSLYPEMFLTHKAREKAGAMRRVMMVFGLLVAFAVPTFIVDVYIPGDPESPSLAESLLQYRIAGIIFCVLIFITGIIHVIWGIREPPYDEMQKKTNLSWKDSFKHTIKNKNFMIFILCSSMNWFVFGLVPMIFPAYGQIVIGEPDAFKVTIILLVLFISSIPGVYFWAWLDKKLGSKEAFLVNMISWALCFIPLFFLTDYLSVLIVFVAMGFVFGGPPYFIDRNISNIADEDELRTGQRREASFYGVHAFIIRLATILNIISINIIFTFNGWGDLVEAAQGASSGGIQLLMSAFPLGAMIIGIIFLLLYKIGKKEADELQVKMRELHSLEE